MKRYLSDGERYFTPKEAAEYFNLSLSTVKNYIYARKIKTLKTPGGHHRIRKSELLAVFGDTGYMSGSKRADSFILMEACSEALLNVFNLFGPKGTLLAKHSRNVSRLSQEIARALKLPFQEVCFIKVAALLHDVGQISLEIRELYDKDRLTGEEYELFKAHSRKGADFIAGIECLRVVSDAVGQHHERPDGNGYPEGLKEGEIDRTAMIISVAEAYDVMVSPYSYRKKIPKNKAIEEIDNNKGSQFDRGIAEAFIKVIC